MNKYPCELIEDLLPLYIEEEVNNETNKIVKEHLKECENCKTLLSQYSKEDLIIDDFKEDFPEANTFKNSMKKLKLWVRITIGVILVILISIGTLGYKIGEKSKTDLLTLKTIVKTFEKQGLSLKKDKSPTPATYDLNGIKPAIFNIGDTKDKLLIYNFKDISEKEKILEETNRFSSNPFSYEEITFNARNAFLVYIPSKPPTNEEDINNFVETNTLISNIIFKYLNDGKEKVYKGESANWEGTFTLKYYEHYTENNGSLRYESSNDTSKEIRYKNSDIENVGAFTFEYTTSVSSGQLTNVTLNKEGYLNFGYGNWSNGAFPKEDDVITFKIILAGKEEIIKLKAD